MKENSPYIKPYRLSCKKCEKEIDARDIIRLDSSNIRNAGGSGEIVTGGNLIKDPQDIIDKPDNITSQILDYQKLFIDDDSSKSRRAYSTIYQIPAKELNLTMDDVVEMVEIVAHSYEEYPCVYAVSKAGEVIRADMIFSNYSVNGEKLTMNFKPQKMTNACKAVMKNKTNNDK